jgi:hypothetical protein
MKILSIIFILLSIAYMHDSNKTKASAEAYTYYYCKHQGDVLNVCN